MDLSEGEEGDKRQENNLFDHGLYIFKCIELLCFLFIDYR